jgi:hypothetical protein
MLWGMSLFKEIGMRASEDHFDNEAVCASYVPLFNRLRAKVPSSLGLR